MTCLAVGAVLLTLSAPAFSLHWTHSVERVEWVEHWSVGETGLRLTEARVKGSGAGMEPGPGAVLRDGWWIWNPQTMVPELNLAASGTTHAGWRLCADGRCRELGAGAGEAIVISPCAP